MKRLVVIGRKKAILAAMPAAALLVVGLGCGSGSSSESRYIFIDAGAHRGEVITLFQTTNLYAQYPWELYAIEANPNLIEELHGALNKRENVYVATLDPASSTVVASPEPFLDSVAGANSAPDWSPDGRYFAYISQRGRGSPGRSVIVVRSLETGKEREFLPEFNLSDPLERDALRWSPDGRFILVRGMRPGGRIGLRGIFQLNVETGVFTPVVSARQRIAGRQVPWSRDGKAFYYLAVDRSTNSDGELAHVLRRDVETGQDSQLHEAPRFAIGPSLAISPDGRRLAFPSGAVPSGEATGLMVISTEGGEVRELLRAQESPRIYWPVLTWAPDGRYVIFGKVQEGQEPVEVWRIPAEGGEPENLGWELDRSTTELRFHPDGRRVAFSARRESAPREEQVTIIDQAISTEEGTVEFFLSAVNDRVGGLYNRAGFRVEPEPIRVKSFDFSQWVETNFSLDDFVILSLDINGGEYPVLEKMVADSTMQYIDRMYVDLKPQTALQRATAVNLIQQVSDAGVFVHTNSGEEALLNYGWIDTLLDPPTLEVPGVDFVDPGAPVPLAAEATARRGGTRVERVEFRVDGAVVGVDREAPYEGTWTARGTGRHRVTATAHDSEGNVTVSAPVTVFVGLRALERSIARSEDDAAEEDSGSVNDISVDLDLGDGVVALRFPEIRIPRGAQIAEAYVQFRAEEADTEPAALIIQAELAGNARPLTRVNHDLSSRTRTAASVTWSPEPWGFGARNRRPRTPDLAALIQEVVDRPDWQEGNALVLLIRGSGRGERDAWSYDGARWRQRPERAPRLYIERR